MDNDKNNILSEYLGIEVTTHCSNGRCGYCFALAGIKERTHMSFVMAKDIVKDGFETGYRKLHLTGGEPTIWPHFFELVTCAFDTGYTSVYINTNAMNLDKELLNKMSEYNNQLFFSVTLNGPKEIHEETRGKNTYEAVLQGISDLLNYNFEVDIFTVVVRKLLLSIPDFVNDLFKEFPVINEQLFIPVHRVHDDEYNVSESLLSPEEFVKLVRMSIVLRLFGRPVSFLDNPLADVISGKMKAPYITSRPYFRKDRLIVLCDGRVTGAHSNRFSFGYYRNGMLKEILSSSEYYKMVGPDSELCPQCEFLSVCRKYGLYKPAENWYNPSDHPFCQSVNRIIEFKQ